MTTSMGLLTKCCWVKPRLDHFLVSCVGSDHDWTSLWSQTSYQWKVSSSCEKKINKSIVTSPNNCLRKVKLWMKFSGRAFFFWKFWYLRSVLHPTKYLLLTTLVMHSSWKHSEVPACSIFRLEKLFLCRNTFIIYLIRWNVAL